MVVHNRDSNEEMLAVVREEAFADLQRRLPLLRRRRSPWPRELIDRGFYLGFSGMITFPKADNVREVIPLLPPDRCLVETDTPYLAPVPYRGKPNRPAYVVEIAERLAQETGETRRAGLARRTGENFFRLFREGALADQTGFGTSMNSTAIPKRSREVLAEGADAQALGGVVAGGEVVDARLARHVHHPLAGLAGDVGVEAVGDRLRGTRAGRRR